MINIDARTSGQRRAGVAVRICAGFMLIVCYPLTALGLIGLIENADFADSSGWIPWLLIFAGGVLGINVASLMFLFGAYLRGRFLWSAERQALTILCYLGRDLLVVLAPMTVGVGLLYSILDSEQWLRALIFVAVGAAFFFLLGKSLRTLGSIDRATRLARLQERNP